MRIEGLSLEGVPLPTPVPVAYAQVDARQWLDAAQAVRDAGGWLLALWAGAARSVGDHRQARSMDAALVSDAGAFWLSLPLDSTGAATPSYPDLSEVFPCAARMERAAFDLSGVRAQGLADTRPWLNHGAWSADDPPLLRDPMAPAPQALALQDYDFVPVQGDGVHEIPVGPVHAGIIEPGHFRFSVVGEKVLRLEQRLGYTHKGIEARMAATPPLQAHRLAGRVSGDSTVAYAWAYCMALESACGVRIPARAAFLRALLLERERVANHLGDLGALGNDAAFSFALAQFSRLREDWLRVNKAVFGHRWLMDCVVPGGVGVDLASHVQRETIDAQCLHLQKQVRELESIFEAHAGLQDRFLTTGRVQPELASRLGLTGLAGRASGQVQDLRHDHPFTPYDEANCVVAVRQQGDVAARVAVRFAEVYESLRLIRHFVNNLPQGERCVPVPAPSGAARGAGWVEGWRGQIWVALEMEEGAAGEPARIARCHLHDPSWQNWPVLEHAILGNIVADFPLINKSFNLSYSGQDV
ncbi:MAG: NADH-quinone oxidoreductase subunit C [Rhodoferax sp.]